ncbi:hypothetical protein ANOBCDAF_03952 [Pleomorphomonas sp. T1.2MG-36]|uniref:hypothetical protein n=1 Tax=Pleomorphomonas sp. T1.2MG-36 TaxID=3041167 RepID=UPI0024774126|nr:hypothetical protein [Pleomorphomonas sp. T1.2MG-36]CAI9417339.1 hypothetical protein ANOBCDAF_03952 [Pleomorphomonas sp. T1.2MG-36]
MTIASEANRSGPYACNGATTGFPYAFKIFDEAHVRVILTDAGGAETTLALGTDYVVTGVGADGGGAVQTAVAHPLGCLVTLILNVPFTQGTDLENQGAYFAETIERALDVLTQQALQLKELIGRSVVLPVTSTVSTTDLVSATLALAEIQSKMEALLDIAPDIQTVAGISSKVVAAQGNAEAASTAAGTATGAAGVATGAATTATQAAVLAEALANAAPQTPVGSGFSARHWAAVAQALSDGFDLDSYLTTDQIHTLLENYAPATRTIAGGAGVKINGGDSATLEDTVTVRLDTASTEEVLAGTVAKPVSVANLWGAGTLVALTDGAAIPIDLASGINFSVVVFGNRTLSDPRNPKVGQSGFIVVSQGGSGGFTLSFGSSYKFFDGLVPDQSITPGAVNVLHYEVISSTQIAISYIRGLA